MNTAFHPMQMLILLGVLATGCTSAWPPHRADPLWHDPVLLDSKDQAIAGIKNLQSELVDWNGGTVHGVDADDFGVRIHSSYLQTNTISTPYSGSYYEGKKYRSYSGTMKETYTVQRDGVVAIPYRDIESMVISRLYWASTYQWGLVIHVRGRSGFAKLRARDEATVRQLANAMATLSAISGNKVATRPKLGVFVDTLTENQLSSLGWNTPRGVLATSVYRGGPAEKAGVRYLDIVLSVDGRPVTTEQEFNAAMNALPSGKTIALTLYRHHQVDSPSQLEVLVSVP